MGGLEERVPQSCWRDTRNSRGTPQWQAARTIAKLAVSTLCASVACRLWLGSNARSWKRKKIPMTTCLVPGMQLEVGPVPSTGQKWQQSNPSTVPGSSRCRQSLRTPMLQRGYVSADDLSCGQAGAKRLWLHDHTGHPESHR